MVGALRGNIPRQYRKSRANIYALDPREALKFLEQNRQSGNPTAKGSQYLEWLIEKLLKNPEEAKYLPRREKAAIKISED